MPFDSLEIRVPSRSGKNRAEQTETLIASKSVASEDAFVIRELVEPGVGVEPATY